MFFRKYKEKLAKVAEDKAIKALKVRKEAEELEAKRIVDAKEEETMSWVESILGTRRFNHKPDDGLDSLFNDLLGKDVLKVERDGHYIKIVTSDSYNYTLWDKNKYYAWCCRGEVTLGTTVLAKWDEAMPRPVTLAKLRLFISDKTCDIGYESINGHVNISKKFTDEITKTNNLNTLINKL